MDVSQLVESHGHWPVQHWIVVIGVMEIELAKSTGAVVEADQHMCCSIDVGGKRAVVHHTDTDAHHHRIATKCTDFCSVSLQGGLRLFKSAQYWWP